MVSRAAFARLTAGSAFFLLIAGGLVTSTGSGLSVPDWPLSFGTLFPPMVGGVLFEHGHRMIAGAVALLTFSLVFWIRREEERLWVRRLAAAAALSILLQALLGGLTVLMKLPPRISIAHACLGQAVFCMLLVLADASGAPPKDKAPEGLWKPAAAATAVVYTQMILGAFVRHAGAGVGWHFAWALVVLLALTTLSLRAISSSRSSALLIPAWFISGFMLLQIGLGFTAFFIRGSLLPSMGYRQAALVTTAHLGLGALLLGACVLMTVRAYRMR